MKNIIKLCTVFLLVLATSSCMNGVRGDGHVVSKKRKISNDFIRINASRGLDVYITKSKNISLEVEADENLHDLITTEVKDGTLYVTATKNIYTASAKKIHISANNINEIMVNSGAEVYSENTFSSEKLAIHVSSGAYASMDLRVDNLTCESSSGAGIELEGEANVFWASSSSGSDIDAYKLTAKECNADASSGANIELMVTESFTGKATSGANIKFKGHPRITEKVNNSGGSIRNTDRG